MTATSTIRSTWPRTKAPRRRSISVHVSRTFLRLGRGMSEQTTSTARSRSKIQYAAAASVKKMPMSDLERLHADPDRRLHELGSVRQVVEALLERGQDLVLHAGRVLGGARDLGLAARAQGVVDLVQRGGHGERESDGERADEGEVVEREAAGARHPVSCEPVDRRPKRGRDDHRGEEQADHEPELPQARGRQR